MSNEHNDRWLETYYEALEDRCFELNGKRQDGKYQSIHLIDFLESHEEITVTDLLCDEITPQQAVQETISRFESWFDEEKSSQGGY